MSGPTVPPGSVLAKVVLSPRALIGQEKKKKTTTTAVDLNWLKGPHWSGRLAGSV